jgi:putative FmdB family regulatory protein
LMPQPVHGGFVLPTYDYECGACGLRFELFQKMSDSPVRICPECKTRRVKRLIGTGAGIIFKGSGFYQTDYRSSSYKQESTKEKSAAGASATESKPKEVAAKAVAVKPDAGKSPASKNE